MLYTLAGNFDMKYTLITGASQGMGLEMAKECASLGRNILLISLPKENLKDLSLKICEEFNVQTDFYEVDLTDKTSAKEIFNWVKKKNYSIDFLINNAGFGGVGAFEEYSLSYLETMIDLNIKATTKMTHYFIPELKKNSPSFILNNASMMANFPCPYKSVYAASKVYIKYFTEALRVELENFGISVSLLQPGATPTNDVVKNQIQKGGFIARLSVTEAHKVARKAVRNTLKGKPVITPGWKNRMSLRFLKVLPYSLLQVAILRSYKSIQKN
jgi:short-subunit dehydrogenase